MALKDLYAAQRAGREALSSQKMAKLLGNYVLLPTLGLSDLKAATCFTPRSSYFHNDLNVTALR